MARNQKSVEVESAAEEEEQPTEEIVEEVEATENDESPEPEKEEPKKKTGRLIVVSAIKESGSVYNIGDVYKGENPEMLLKSGALKEE